MNGLNDENIEHLTKKLFSIKMNFFQMNFENIEE
jgi:hypothetical protein